MTSVIKVRLKLVIVPNVNRPNSVDCRLYLARFENQAIDEDQWLSKEKIPNADVLLRKFRASKRGQNGSGLMAILFWGGECQPQALE
jgi:hypothetical protein